jgi:hypothetical protein
MTRRAGTYETEKMKATVPLLGMFTAVEDDLILVELLLLDRHVDLDNILPDDTSSADVEVSVYAIELENKVGLSGSGATHPTSELPMRPSLRPTDRPCACRVRTLCVFAIVSILVVSAASIASPFIPFSGAMPQPSWTLQNRQRPAFHSRVSSCTHMRQTLFLTSTMF